MIIKVLENEEAIKKLATYHGLYIASVLAGKTLKAATDNKGRVYVVLLGKKIRIFNECYKLVKKEVILKKDQPKAEMNDGNIYIPWALFFYRRFQSENDVYT